MTKKTKSPARIEMPETLAAIIGIPRCHGSVNEQTFVRDTLLTLSGHPNVSAFNLDELGNVWVWTHLQAETLFTCHTDTVHTMQALTHTVMYDPVKGEAVKKDGMPLGADDGAGIWLLLEMIEANVPGVYVFYRGEEKGGIGSRGSTTIDPNAYSQYKRAVAFDRRGISDVITHQTGGRCCSDTFAFALAEQLNDHLGDWGYYAPSDDGIFTDTANLTDLVGECTNVSCGYDHEHSGAETLNVGFLLALRDAVIATDWAGLPTEREPGDYDDDRWALADSKWASRGYNGKVNYVAREPASLYELYQMTDRELDDWVYTCPEQAADTIRMLLDKVTDNYHASEGV